jgi:hypothetical protein
MGRSDIHSSKAATGCGLTKWRHSSRCSVLTEETDRRAETATRESPHGTHYIEVIDPDSSFADYLRPILRKLMYQALTGPQLFDDLRHSVMDAAELSIQFPERIDRLLGEIERSNLRVWTRVEDIDLIVKRVEHASARTNATMLAGACIVAVALIMQIYHPRGWQGWIGVVFWKQWLWRSLTM